MPIVNGGELSCGAAKSVTRGWVNSFFKVIPSHGVTESLGLSGVLYDSSGQLARPRLVEFQRSPRYTRSSVSTVCSAPGASP